MLNRSPNRLNVTSWQAAVLAAVLLTAVGSVQAQSAIYRCGNEYTNNAAQAKQKGCRLVEGGNVTVVEAPKPPAKTTRSAAAPADTGKNKVDDATQRQRDSDARAILEAELQKAQTRVQELEAEYANGQPNKQGAEFRNYGLYQERVAALKEKLDRARADVEGIQRELARTDNKH